jgi:hypothetical protein
MGLDIIEIALDKISDATEFEKVANEILLGEGYHNIRPLPGGNDFGQDAIEDKFFENVDRFRTVFQHSLQANVKAKVKNTIERLNEAKIEFNELVFVTPRGITGETQENLKKEIRAEFGIMLDIIERETIITRLSDFTNGLFSRHFPSIEKQLEALKSAKPIFNEEYVKTLELSLLKVSIAFTFNRDAIKARKEVFDNLILSLIYDIKADYISFEQLLEFYKQHIDNNFTDSNQIKIALDRLNSKKLLSNKEGQIKIPLQTKEKLEASTIKANELTESLLSDVVAKVADITKTKFSNQDIGRIKKNSLQTLLEIFKLHGLELSDRILNEKLNLSDLTQSLNLINSIKKDLPPKIGEVLIAVMGDIMQNPTEKQAETLGNWAKAYLGVKLMNFDPNLKELQYVQMSKKTFFLDTDFVLNCIVKERPSQQFYVKIVNSLIKLGCKVVIPKCVFDEALKNASISIRSFHYFGSSLFGLNPTLVDCEVKNLFVQGYYFYYKNVKKISFNNYLDNYYYENNPEDFFKDVIYDSLPSKVTIQELSSFDVQIPAERLLELSNSIQEKLKKALKAKHRNEEQSKELADNDAKLFFTCYYLNGKENHVGRILGGTAYLLTLSQKFIKCTKDIGIVDIITTKPQTIASILDIVGKGNLDSKELLKLMDNPFLIYSVDQSWNDINLLVKSGIELNDKSFPKLKWDLQESLHNQISEYELMSQKENTSIENTEFDEPHIKKFIDLVQTAEKLGYKKVPALSNFLNELNGIKEESSEIKEQLIDMNKKYENLEKEIDRFGKRKQNYLNKISNRKKGNKSN